MSTNKFTKEMVDDYAEKLLIGLREEENELVLKDFAEIDRQIDLINNIPNIEKVSPMTHTLDDFVYELRDDVCEESISIEEALSNCDNHNEEEVIVPKVVGE